MENYIILETYDNNFEADLAKGLLEENGITVELKNQIFNSLYPTFAGDMFRLELYVPQEQAEAARQLLNSSMDCFFVQKALLEEGALLEGHFLLTSGRHSAKYIEKIRILQNPMQASALCTQMANHLSGLEFDVVVGPAYGGIALAFEVARQLGSSFLFTQRKDDKMIIRSGFDLSKIKKAIVIEDIVTTGGSVLEVMECLKSRSIEVVAVAAIVDRTCGKAEFGCPFIPLLTIDVPSWEPEECDLCKTGIPITTPGSSDKK